MSLCFDISASEDSIQEIGYSLLSALLYDHTACRNILWATDNYRILGEKFAADKEIQPELITGRYNRIIQSRISKAKDSQINRTHEKAEVFTPAWICNKQNNLIDELWFGRKDVFNVEAEKSWSTTPGSILFPDDPIKGWKQYVDSKRLEVTCGEGPYLTSRYDSVTGDPIPVKDRIGILDRKLRVVCENAGEAEWTEWGLRALQSTYGFEYQGDNLLLARENVLFTFLEHHLEQFGYYPSNEIMDDAARIISWNIWQMDGLSNTVPFSRIEDGHKQMTLFDSFEDIDADRPASPECKIMDWCSNSIIKFSSVGKGAEK